VALISLLRRRMELRKEQCGLLLEPDLSADGDSLCVVLPRRLTVALPSVAAFSSTAGASSSSGWRARAR
jgi:hypothetical protein